MNTDKTLPEDILASHSGHHVELLTGAFLNEPTITPAEAIASMQEYGSHCIHIEVEELKEKYYSIAQSHILADKTIKQQAVTIAELLEGLEKIVSPVKFMQIDAEKKSYHLDGMMAIQLSKDPSYLQEIAKQLLNKHKP